MFTICKQGDDDHGFSYMHVISKKPFLEAMQQFPNASSSILNLYHTLDKGNFMDPHQMKHIFPSLDNFKYKDKWWVIDINGNHLRMIAVIDFQYQKIFVKHLVTHAEYDKLCKKYAGESR